MTYDTINDAVTMRPGGGAVLGRIDKYELVSELGEGGFGAVYLARDTVAKTDVAIKGLPPEVKHNNAELEGIRANFALVKRLRHPNIVAVTDLHQALAVSYASKEVEAKLRLFPQDTMVVMDYAPGVTLSKWRKQFSGGKVPLDNAVSVIRQVASALDYAHEQKVLHRDVKPANVVVETSSDGSRTARVLDFGLAAEIRSSMGRLSREIRDTSGTRPYMAPEQWLGHRQGPATDQYALAVIFYELVAGEVPFASVFDCGDPAVMRLAVTTDAPDIPSDLPKGVRNALAKALAKKPEDRFASCSEFVAALEGKVKVARGGSAPKGGAGKLFAILALLAALGAGGYYGWTKYDAHVKAQKAEESRIAVETARIAEEKSRIAAEKARIAKENAAEEDRARQKVYELFGDASRARGDNVKEEWHDWPHFSLKSSELEESYQSGTTALKNGDYLVASNRFAKVCDNWRWLSLSKKERLEAVSSLEKADKGMTATEKADAARWNSQGWIIATNLHAQAHGLFLKGDFSSAKKVSDAAVSAFANSLLVANAARATEEKRANEERIAAERKEAERNAAERERRAEEEKRKKAEKTGATAKMPQPEKPKTKLSPAAQKLVGSWSCRCDVTYHDSLGSRADDLIKSYLPVSSTISLRFSEDGSVFISDSSGRTFGTSNGKWKYRHGMVIMDLKSDDGRTFTLSGTVNWRGNSFELHYDNNEYANMIRKSCERRITDVNAVLSSYVDGQMEVSISTKLPTFKNGSARCSPHVFSRQERALRMLSN